MEVCVPREGGSRLAWAQEAPPTTRAPLPAEADLPLELRKSQVGGGQLCQGLEPALTQSCRSKPRESLAQWPQALHPRPTPHPDPHAHLHQFPYLALALLTWPVPCLPAFSLQGSHTWGPQEALQGFVPAGSPAPNAPPSLSRFDMCVQGNRGNG